MIAELPVLVDGPADGPPAGLSADHPMRRVTRQIAFEPGAWDAERRNQVTELFNGLAEDWSSRDVSGREAPILDALDRGLAAAPSADRRVALDVGGGNGINTRHLVPTFPNVITVDIAPEMLRLAADRSPRRVLADSASLPVADRAVDAVLLINAFLFPREVQRVLSPDGVVVWVNSRGVGTPIHLPAADVDRALPGEWTGVSSSAGWGTWSVHWRR